MLYPGFGLDPYSYDRNLDLQIDFKALGRNCKAVAKKVARKLRLNKVK